MEDYSFLKINKLEILIAGGTGLIGKELVKVLKMRGHNVTILSRKAEVANIVNWDPDLKKIDASKISETEVLINLCGSGIADKRWSRKRKKELLASRIKPAEFLYELRSKMPRLKQYISASGISCYGFSKRPEPYTEKDNYGSDFISELVKKWESSAAVFAKEVNVAKLRIAFVLSSNGGAMSKMLQPIKWGLGAPIGNGKQIIQWIHIADLANMFVHVLENQIRGTYNTASGNTANREMMEMLAGSVGRRIWLPPIPAVLIKLLFGEMADLFIHGVSVSSDKIRSTGFKFQYNTLKKAIAKITLE
jgi:uncharacterized protein (TIGR01777 family)